MTTRRVASVPSDARDLRGLTVRLLDRLLALGSRETLEPATVHDIRRQLKRARAWLAVLGPAMSSADRDAVNRALRDAGRSLSRARDHAVLEQTYARTAARAAVPMTARRAAKSHARTIPTTHAVEPPLPDATNAARMPDPGTAHTLIAKARHRLAVASVEGSGWPSLGPGFREVYRRGRRKAPAPGSSPRSTDLHEWRKRTKRYGYALELFVPADPDTLGKRLRRARRLAQVLGEEHDLAMLVARLRKSDLTPSLSDQAILRTATERRAALSGRALKLGAEVYIDGPKDVERDVKTAWRARPRA